MSKTQAADATAEPQTDTYAVVCPYCKHRHEPAYEFSSVDENEEAIVDCEGCERKFSVKWFATYTYETNSL